MSEEYRTAVGVMFATWCDTISQLAPHLTREGLYWCIRNLRPDPPALWAGIYAPWDAQRDLLRYRLIELAEAQGEPWPFPLDKPPMVPDFPPVLSP